MYIKSFNQINKDNVSLVGGKGASLGELFNSGIPVPDGFVITTDAFKQFFKQELSADFIEQLLKSFDELGAELVAVRSSAVAEDSGSASWAGQLDSYLNTKREDLLDRIKDCWNSIKNERALEYADQNHIPKEDLLVAVVIQKMVKSDSSGVLFTVNPMNNNYKEVMIEACYGLGELLVQGMVTPDNYLIDKKTGELKNISLNTQDKMLIHESGENREVDVISSKKGEQILTEHQIKELVNLGKRIEEHYQCPQDIEWAIEKDTVYIVQSRPITTLENNHNSKMSTIFEDYFLKGIGVSTGFVTGQVIIVNELNELAHVDNDVILVTKKTTPDFVEVFPKIKGLITESGGITSHAAIVAREMNIPAIVGVENATSKLKNGDLITIDARNGRIFLGELSLPDIKSEELNLSIASKGNAIDDFLSAISLTFNDVAELWPLRPGQLFSYFDVNQALDMYAKLIQLENEGKSIKEIAQLFESPHSVRSFLINTGVIGLKIAYLLKIGNISKNDLIKFFTMFDGILKELTIEDPYCLDGKNVIWNNETVEGFYRNAEWISVDKELKNSLINLSAHLFTFNWAFFWDYFDAAGEQMHGPYHLADNSLLVVKEYYAPSQEIWVNASTVPFKKIRLSLLLNKIPIFINYANRIITKDSVIENCISFMLEIDDEKINDESTIRDLSLKLMHLAKEQSNYVNDLADLEKVKKGAQLSYVMHKKFYQYFNQNWFPEDDVNQEIEKFGNEWIEKNKNERNKDLETKLEIFDPRTDILAS
jgi:phosphohistidine swiveling domain-containing protein